MNGQNNNTTSNTNAQIEQQNIGMMKLFKGGYNFSFQDGNNRIECWGSSVNGKEAVYVNGKLVSEFRNMFSRKSLHKFTVDGVPFEVEFNMVSIMRAELHCVVIKDGVHFQTKKVCPTNITNKKPLTLKRVFLEGFVFGVVGFFCGYLIAKLFTENDTVIQTMNSLLAPINTFFS